MAKEVIQTKQAAAPVGPYNQAIAAQGKMIFVSGQVALEAKTGTLVGDGDVVAQTKQVMANVEAILTAANASWENVVKTTIYLTDLSHFGTVNEIYGSYFDPETAPARACIEVSRLPKGALVEVECMAMVSDQ
ncbi:endoribonuclease L-PSP [Halothece sp. PCC 7418]|uniref:Rid family detoxifying hydrolase n=1 Tax=Halothece sp. (strain PCC 7418) TaxID=65093 RepID=UPI0002A06898|nr:Rid family detoxifying hydrolase [Halothece sp. PCC 7418]AFZ45467.1 endoribonuclease L-PSP [Halothece sp. PCC 7418]